jgi:hypothetical protein
MLPPKYYRREILPNYIWLVATLHRCRTASLLCVCRSWPAARAAGFLWLIDLPNEPICAKVPTGPGINRIYTWWPVNGGNWALGAGQRQTWLPTGPLLRVGGWDIFLRNSRQGLEQLNASIGVLLCWRARMPRNAPCALHGFIFPTKTTEAHRRRSYNI